MDIVNSSGIAKANIARYMLLESMSSFKVKAKDQTKASANAHFELNRAIFIDNSLRVIPGIGAGERLKNKVLIILLSGYLIAAAVAMIGVI